MPQLPGPHVPASPAPSELLPCSLLPSRGQPLRLKGQFSPPRPKTTDVGTFKRSLYLEYVSPSGSTIPKEPVFTSCGETQEESLEGSQLSSAGATRLPRFTSPHSGSRGQPDGGHDCGWESAVTRCVFSWDPLSPPYCVNTLYRCPKK